MLKIVLAFALTFAQTAFAGSYQFAPAATPATPTTTATSTSGGTAMGEVVGVGGSSSTTTATTPAATQVPSPPPAPSINPAANTGQASQKSGAGANTAAGMALMASGMAMMSNPSTQPMGAALLAMGLLAMAQAAEDSGAAQQSAQTAAASNLGTTGTGNNGTATPPANPALNAGAATFNTPQVVAAKQALTSAGYTVAGNQVTATPDGTPVSASTFGSSGSLAAAGFDANALKEAQRIAAGVSGDMPRISGMGVSEGGGGAASPVGSGDARFSPSFANPFNLNANAKKQMIAGKTVLFDGDPIGVRSQDIFEMVHTAYDKKTARGNFLGNEEVSVRAPASVAAPKPTSISSTKRPR